MSGARQPPRNPDMDEIAVERAITGDPPESLSVADRLAAIDILTGRGVSARQIAAILRVSRRTVSRYRRELRRRVDRG